MIPKFTKAFLLAMIAGSPVWAQAGLSFVPVPPCRVVDTREADGAFGGPAMEAGETRSFAIPQGSCNIPATAQAYSLNVTVVPEGFLAYLSLWPTGQTQPTVSTLNSYAGSVVANAAIVPAGTGGAVSVYVYNPTHVILDINGYFDTSTGATSYSFYPATPCRVVDTRGATGAFGGPTMQANQSRSFPAPQSSCDIPATARAYSLNFTVVPEGFLGYLSTWPTGQQQPNVSTLNSYTGSVVANAALVPAGTNEAISVFVTNPTDVIADINGYFGQPGSAGALSFYPVTPCRVADTRNATGPFGGPIMASGETRPFAIPAGACNIPSTAAAYSLNVTVVPDGALYYLSVWPTGVAQPVVSTLNSYDGSVLANAAIVPAGTNGAIDIYVTGQTQVILDINGYFAPASSGPVGGDAVAERALVQDGLSIALASNVLQSQMYVIFATGTQSLPCHALSGGGSVNSGSTPTTSVEGNPVYPVTVYYDTQCTQPYVAADLTSLTQTGDGSGVIVETATYSAQDGATLGTMTLNMTLKETLIGDNIGGVSVYGLGVFTASGGLQKPIQLGLSCAIASLSGATNVPCTGGVAQDFPSLDLAIGSVTSITLNLSGGVLGQGGGSVSFTGSGSTVTGSIGGLTLTNPSPASFVIQGGTAYASTTNSGSAAAFGLFPPTPTGWSVIDAGHDQTLQISVIDDITLDSSITITQTSTGKTLVTGTVDHSGTGTVTYSDGTTAPITSWTLGD